MMVWEMSPWKPFRELERMRREMDRLWNSFFEGRPSRKVEEAGEWAPTLDVLETKNDLVVKAEIPGIDPKDIDISLANEMLTIKGEKRKSRGSSNGSALFFVSQPLLFSEMDQHKNSNANHDQPISIFPPSLPWIPLIAQISLSLLHSPLAPNSSMEIHCHIYPETSNPITSIV